ncbi:hypothetical protein M441DRAFT_22032 [Trichoderma asperellum CBS 433.97]|uniref:DUF7136 domain-containing protein n=1 Tax=Trichoderma asperellum (strain ATCC 204424 / CBS 433.97 / NBRC 101777) TaxID=1042311 RepID=A0A2T3ZM96_TRIA4|nr:hypothetical protein M441DRAFT_22032 [Trichoderma asperellum CBS 433.97]PTB45912.1 hypothetical protein M441DRAFT_22032 [Trichoderma asperellum CBS 433.97]
MAKMRSPILEVKALLQSPPCTRPCGMIQLWEGNNQIFPDSIPSSIELIIENLTLSDPYLATGSVNTLAYPDGFWTLTWYLEYGNCSQHGTTFGKTTFTTLTISKSGQAPDLVAATSADKHDTTDAIAFNMTSLGPTCGMLRPSPTTNPCAATINSAAASSIPAAATAFACDPIQRQLIPISPV